MDSDVGAKCAATVFDTMHLMMRSIGQEMERNQSRTLSVQQFRALMTVKMSEGPSLSHVAKHMGTTASSASRLIDGLVDRGLLIRKTASDDRRKSLLSITADGENLLEAVHLEGLTIVHDRLRGLTSTEYSLVTLAMDLLRSAFTRKRTGNE